jgi:hypothetical protein
MSSFQIKHVLGLYIKGVKTLNTIIFTNKCASTQFYVVIHITLNPTYFDASLPHPQGHIITLFTRHTSLIKVK